MLRSRFCEDMSDGKIVETSKPGRTRVRPVQPQDVVSTTSHKVTKTPRRVGISRSQSDHLIGTQKGQIGHCRTRVNVSGRSTATPVKQTEDPCRRQSSFTECCAKPFILKSILKPATVCRTHVEADTVKESHEDDARKKQDSSRLDDIRWNLRNELEVVTETPRRHLPHPLGIQMEPSTQATYLSLTGMLRCLWRLFGILWALVANKAETLQLEAAMPSWDSTMTVDFGNTDKISEPLEEWTDTSEQSTQVMIIIFSKNPPTTVPAHTPETLQLEAAMSSQGSIMTRDLTGTDKIPKLREERIVPSESSTRLTSVGPFENQPTQVSVTCGTMQTFSLWISLRMFIDYVCQLLSSSWSVAGRLLLSRKINPRDSLLTLRLKEKFEEAAGIRQPWKSYERFQELLRELPLENEFVLEWLVANGFIREANARKFGQLLNVKGHVLKVFAENPDLFDDTGDYF